MKTKFQVGDKVKIVKVYGAPLPEGFRRGNVGRIINVLKYNYPHNYEIYFENHDYNEYFSARELEKVN